MKVPQSAYPFPLATLQVYPYILANSCCADSMTGTFRTLPSRTCHIDTKLAFPYYWFITHAPSSSFFSSSLPPPLTYFSPIRALCYSSIFEYHLFYFRWIYSTTAIDDGNYSLLVLVLPFTITLRQSLYSTHILRPDFCFEFSYATYKQHCELQITVKSIRTITSYLFSTRCLVRRSIRHQTLYGAWNFDLFRPFIHTHLRHDIERNRFRSTKLGRKRNETAWIIGLFEWI